MSGIAPRMGPEGSNALEVDWVQSAGMMVRRAAYEQVRPAGLDVCSGLRTDGLLDSGKLRAFLAAVQ